MKTVTIDGDEYVRAADVQVPQVSGDFVILRCKGAGVHAGTLSDADGKTYVLVNSRRLWRWWSKFSLSGLAMEGPLPSKLSEQRYACVLPRLEIPAQDVCEIISCTDTARDAIMAVPEWRNE